MINKKLYPIWFSRKQSHKATGISKYYFARTSLPCPPSMLQEPSLLFRERVSLNTHVTTLIGCSLCFIFHYDVDESTTRWLKR